jgi:CheY-like chemotaxis protein
MAQKTAPAKTLLIVEDNPVVREELSLALRRRGYSVAIAANGRQALEQLRDSAFPDLILLDMLMPVMDGWQFLKELRQLAPRPSVPIIITTGSIVTRDWALDHGAVGFLKKPFSDDELVTEVQRCC